MFVCTFVFLNLLTFVNLFVRAVKSTWRYHVHEVAGLVYISCFFFYIELQHSEHLRARLNVHSFPSFCWAKTKREYILNELSNSPVKTTFNFNVQISYSFIIFIYYSSPQLLLHISPLQKSIDVYRGRRTIRLWWSVCVNPRFTEACSLPWPCK